MSERRGTKALELWCRRITEGYPGVKIDNMTTSWRDGLAFCAMIHHFRPDLIDFEKLNKSEVYYNNTLAFTTAEKYLGIPALLDADDMATYEVPDRLSILTYLSQFYQVFAAQEAHNRLKRSSSSGVDNTQISQSPGPPTKMAHVVGVPKRDPCRKCGLPVFLAERLMVGQNVYHRTCLKCARCGCQLTPGSFYETEIDEQYCCETCPDEEVAQEIMEQLSSGNEVTEANCSNAELRNTVESETNVLKSPHRNSIKERLAYFESYRDNDNLQTSLSDEEKSKKSLQRIESLPETVEASYKPKADLTDSFIKIFDGNGMETSDSKIDTADLANVSLPPALPRSMPPLEDFQLEKKHNDIKRFSVSAQLVLSSSPNITTFEKVDEQPNVGMELAKGNDNSELQNNTLSSTFASMNNTNINDEEHVPVHRIEYTTEEQQTEEKTAKIHSAHLENNLDFSETNDNDCITKDKSADELTTKTTAEDLQLINRKDTTQIMINLMITPDEIQSLGDKEAIENGVVELRTKTNLENSNIATELENNYTTELVSVKNECLQQFEVITNNDKEETISCKQSREEVVESEIPINEDDIASELIINESVDTITDEKTTCTNDDKIKTETENLKITSLNDQVPLTMEREDIDIATSSLNDKKEHVEKNNFKESIIQTPQKNNSKITIEEYPDDLNPFKSDEEGEEVLENNKENVDLITSDTMSEKRDNLNPFDSSDDEIELEKQQKTRASISLTSKVPPPRPPPPRISKNPFGSEDEAEISIQNFARRSSLTGSQNRKTPVPTPRSNISQSQNPTPEPTPRLSTKINTTTIGFSSSTTNNNSSLPILQNSSEFYGSANSLYSNNATPSNPLRNSDTRASNNSLNLSAGGTIRSRKSRRAPLPPAPVKELFPSIETINSSSKTSTPSSSTVGTPKSARKKRPAPAPPKPARLETTQAPQLNIETVITQQKNLNDYPLQSELDSKLSDEEKALLEGKALQSLHSIQSDLLLTPSSRRRSKRLIPLDQELLEEHGSLHYAKEINSQCDDLKQQNQHKSSAVCEEEPSVVYRRVLIPHNLETPTHEHNPLIEHLSESPLGERQLEKLKDNKEANNRNRQSQVSVTSSAADDNDPLFNKSSHGKWKRRKGPAPALPIPPRKVLQMLPLQEIKHELEIIEVQQQGLEKQGVILEKMIRDRCEGENGELLNSSEIRGESEDSTITLPFVENSKEVENLILQLFELVNEKNELFRRQAELMYLRRQHRLEHEQADLEYEIRLLMAQPERNKTDSDKAREEALIERLVEVVKLRNEVVECLEMDRLREAEEDQSIKQRLELHIAKRGDDSNSSKTLTKLSKKEKKKQKEAKKLFKSKKLVAEKDADESELNVDKQKSKKKKKLLIF